MPIEDVIKRLQEFVIIYPGVIVTVTVEATAIIKDIDVYCAKESDSSPDYKTFVGIEG